MINFIRNRNRLRDEILPITLNRTGERVNRLRKDWSRDFGFQIAFRDKAWTLWMNTHKDLHFRKVWSKVQKSGMRFTVEVDRRW